MRPLPYFSFVPVILPSCLTKNVGVRSAHLFATDQRILLRRGHHRPSAPCLGSALPRQRSAFPESRTECRGTTRPRWCAGQNEKLVNQYRLLMKAFRLGPRSLPLPSAGDTIAREMTEGQDPAFENESWQWLEPSCFSSWPFPWCPWLSPLSRSTWSPTAISPGQPAASPRSGPHPALRSTWPRP